MDYKYIEQLLERYWRCETTLEEEKILRMFFAQKDVPANLLPYKDLFVYEQTETQSDALGDDFDEKMMEKIEVKKAVKARIIPMRQRLMPLFKAAAVVAIILTLGNAMQVAMYDKKAEPADVANIQKPHEGPSVAKADSSKLMDSTAFAHKTIPSTDIK